MHPAGGRILIKSQQGERYSVAVVQAASVAFDLERSLAKAQSLAADAARKGARLVLFPEAFLPGYPRGLDFGDRTFWHSVVLAAALGLTAHVQAYYLPGMVP